MYHLVLLLCKFQCRHALDQCLCVAAFVALQRIWQYWGACLPHAMLRAPATSPATPDSCMVRRSVLAAPTPAGCKETSQVRLLYSTTQCILLQQEPMADHYSCPYGDADAYADKAVLLKRRTQHTGKSNCHNRLNTSGVSIMAAVGQATAVIPACSPSIKDATETRPSFAPSTKARTAGQGHRCRLLASKCCCCCSSCINPFGCAAPCMINCISSHLHQGALWE